MLLDVLLHQQGIDPLLDSAQQAPLPSAPAASHDNGEPCSDKRSANAYAEAFQNWVKSILQPLQAGLPAGEFNQWLQRYCLPLWEISQKSPPDRSPPDRKTRFSPSVSPLVTLRSKGAKMPVFFVHALLGSVFHYHRLAALLDPERPVYALQAPGLDGVERPLDDVADFAELYLQSMRSVQPHGPYQLGGYSLGGWIAFEMARRLSEQGEKVSQVLILGTDVPLSISLPSVYEQIAFLYQYQQDFQNTILEPFLPYEERIRLHSGADQDPSGSPLMRLVQAHSKAVLLYEPQPYAGKITLLETIEQQVLRPFDPSRGWKKLSLQPVASHLVAGNHLSMLNEPHVKDLAEKINYCLNKTA